MQRLRRRAAVSAVLLLVWSGSVAAHAPAPDHGCLAPDRPVDDQDDVRWQGYLDAVDDFRACISAFVERNQAAAAAHGDAARRATQAWNEFVRTNLNVPEDYPWPPEPRDASR